MGAGLGSRDGRRFAHRWALLGGWGGEAAGGLRLSAGAVARVANFSSTTVRFLSLGCSVTTSGFCLNRVLGEG